MWAISSFFLLHTHLCAGDIGGQMGLFIGASILTILELFDYAYEVSDMPFFFSFTYTFSKSRF